MVGGTHSPAPFMVVPALGGGGWQAYSMPSQWVCRVSGGKQALCQVRCIGQAIAAEWGLEHGQLRA